MFKNLVDWFLDSGISLQCGLLALAGMMVFIKSYSREDFLVAVLLLLYVAVDVAASVLAYLNMNNIWLYNITLFPEFIFTMLLLTRSMSFVGIKKWLNTGMIIISLLHVVNVQWGQGLHAFASFTYLPATALLAVAAYFYLKERLEETDSIPFTNWITWFAMALLIDHVGSLPILTVLGWSDFITQPFANKLYAIVTWLYAFWYLIIFTGLLWTRTSIRSRFSSR